MATKTKFSEKDIPYGKFAKLGIKDDVARSLPREVSEKLLNGEITPLIRTRMHSRSGNTFEIPMRLQMIRGADGSIKLMAYPVRKKVANDIRLSKEEADRINKGETLCKEFIENGVRNVKFIQMDKQTKSLIKVNAKQLQIQKRLSELESVNNIQLGINQREAIRDGKPVELAVGDQKVTVGVDLREQKGFKVVKGDMDEWKKQKLIRYDLENEGFMGYVMTDKNRWEYKQVVSKERVNQMNIEEKQDVRRKAGYTR